MPRLFRADNPNIQIPFPDDTFTFYLSLAAVDAVIFQIVSASTLIRLKPFNLKYNAH
jgi:hypothetical protein